MNSDAAPQADRPDSIWKRLFGDWTVHLEKPVPEKELSQALGAGSIPSGGFYLMLGLSAGIATLGLISDSAAVIIGAMIIAPLMNPITSLAFASVRGKDVLMMRSLLTLVSGILLVLAVSCITTWIIGGRVVGSEILSRTNPTLLDLGVAIGAGAAGAFALTRSNIGNAIPGVAVAVALVPPLCVTGIGFAFGTKAIIDPAYQLTQSEVTISGGAFLLFLTNLVAILLFGGAVFVVQGYGHWRVARRQIVVVVIALVLMAIPLSYAFRTLYYRGKVLTTLRAVAKENPDWGELQIKALDVDLLANPVLVRLDLRAPERAFDDEDLGFVEEGVRKRLKQPVRFEIYLTEFAKLVTPRGNRASSRPVPGAATGTEGSE